MKSKAQGAMEYLMTYGWAILVVMIVGLAMWRLGVFNITQEAPATSTGFSALKPLLPTCVLRARDTWTSGPEYRGFTCQFTNAAGKAIRLEDIDIHMNDDYCRLAQAGTTLMSEASSKFVRRYYVEADGSCQAIGGYPAVEAPNTNDACDHTQIPDPNFPVIASGDTFFVMLYSSTFGFDSFGICENGINMEDMYVVDIDITYEFELGGDTVTKTSSGTIRLSAEA